MGESVTRLILTSLTIQSGKINRLNKKTAEVYSSG
jgi:hypothetical protein